MEQACQNNCLKDGYSADQVRGKLAEIRQAIYTESGDTALNYALACGTRVGMTACQIGTTIAAVLGVTIPAALTVDLLLTLGSEVTVTINHIQLEGIYKKLSSHLDELSRWTYQIIDLDCWDNCETCGRNPKHDGDHSDSKDPTEPDYKPMTQPVIDPAGYIYEAVASNRLSGVTAKVYYKDTDGIEKLWSAEEAAIWGEVNPQITNDSGTYAWYTPIGNWRVKVTKDGYYDADSTADPASVNGWLPVPPPQMNVNIGMISRAAPTVSGAYAASDGITITFSQYMDTAQFETAGLLTVTQNGNDIPVSVTFTDKEESPTKPGVFYGRAMKLIRADGQPFSGSNIVIRVAQSAKNYADTTLTAPYTSPTLRVGVSTGSIEHSYPNRYVTSLGKTDTLALRVLDHAGQPASGVTVTVSAAAGNILTVLNVSAISDTAGIVRFHVNGAAVGEDTLTFRTSGGAQATMTIAVTADTSASAKPTANLSDYAVVSSGTKLIVTAQEGAVIRYTTDNTCPCTDAALTYTGPITLTESGFYRIAAWTEVGGYSERLNLHITVNADQDPSGGGASSGGSSGGGSSSSSRRYDVSAPSVKHGDVTVSPKSASKGDTVTITVKPDSGYELDTLTVKDASGSKIKVKDKGDGKFTFTMPASKVTVSAEFAEIETLDFADVPTDAYYYEAVKWAAKKGITGGIGNGLFGPNQPCTRAQIVTFLWRAAGSPEPKTMSSFADVSMDAYYAKAVAWAVENGITTGTGDGKFSPDATCTRAQSVTFLFRAIGKLVDSKAEFSDVLADSYYANAVDWAVENGVTNGIGDGLFGPDNSCTRAQIVTFLYRAYQGK